MPTIAGLCSHTNLVFYTLNFALCDETCRRLLQVLCMMFLQMSIDCNRPSLLASMTSVDGVTYRRKLGQLWKSWITVADTITECPCNKMLSFLSNFYM